MDDIKKTNHLRPKVAPPTRHRIDVGTVLTARPATVSAAASHHKKRVIRIRLSFRTPAWLQHVGSKLLSSRVVKYFRAYLPSRRKHPLLARMGWGAVALVMIGTFALDSFRFKIADDRYDLSTKAMMVIGEPNPILAPMLRLNAAGTAYEYNKDYKPGGEVAGLSASPKFSAVFSTDTDALATTISDPVTSTSMTFKPLYKTAAPRQQQNRLVYPLVGLDAQKVYTLKSIGMKEDIVLNKYQADARTFTYKLELTAGTEARMESNGVLAIYGADPALLGNVSTATDKDAELLDKARRNAAKTQLLYTFPAPFVREFNKKVSAAKAWFELKGDILELHASGLKDASYPLTIDPSVYIETAAKLMRGNNETNVDFDITNELIQKSQTTGARIDNWTATTDLNTAIWAQGTAVAGGYIYSAGGLSSSQSTKTTTYTAGSSSFVVPTGVTSIVVKAWGAGGGGGSGNNNDGVGGNGGGGGYARATIATTPAESLTVLVGTAGAAGASNSSDAGGGGGFSAVQRSGTYLIQAGGGAGGGGGRGSAAGGNGGAGGGASGVAGSPGTGTATVGGAGGAGTTGAGGGAGAAGTGGTAGTAGAANAGGNGGAAGTGGTGGTGGGGSGSTAAGSGGGGGGGGRFGGGGGGSTSTASTRGGGGGGGGSSLVTGVFTDQIAGIGKVPGNNGDVDRSTAGAGGAGNESGAGTAGTPGAIVITYTVPSSIAATTAVSWAKFDASTNTITSPIPGSSGACSGWCSDSAYALPAARKGLSLVAYNGYLYAIGGQDAGCTAGASTGATGTCYTVYVAKLGANGEPSLWHPSGGSAVYWYRDANLSSERAFFGAATLNNRLYLIGGLNGSNTTLTTVQYATINPTGTLGSWTSGTALGTARYGLTAQIYNSILYAIGGDATFTGSPISTVQYVRLNSDGTMNSWVTTTSLATSGRLTLGGSFSAIWGGYIYVAGGCTAVNGSGYCTAMASDLQLASINADGSLAPWNTMVGIENARMGYTLIAWQNGLYRLGGCESQDASTGTCNFIDNNVEYGVVNPDGESSTVATSSASGTAPCSGGAPTNCDLPGSATVGNVVGVSAIMNGYLYVMGGCTDDDCGTVSRGVVYSSIASDGTLSLPASCGTWTAVDDWCTNTTSLPVALGAAGTATFNGRLYIVGGFPNISVIYYAAPASDGSIASWSNNDLTTIGAVDVSYPFAYARANPSSAGTNPGNLYIFGGCTSDGNVSCTTMTQNVYKCNISTTGAVASCSTTSQLQIGTVTDGAGNSASGTGLGAMAGTVYANYIYLMGGLAPSLDDLRTTRYAKFDNNNNVVTAGTGWEETSNADGNLTAFGRRRGAGFGYNGYLYVVGGYDGTTGGGVLADIEFAKINVSDGSIGAFTVSTVSINQRWGLTVPVSNSYAYVIGGCINGIAPTGCQIRTDTIQTFQVYNNDSGAVQSFTTSSGNFAASTDRWGASSAVLNGFLYVAGGCTSATDCTTAISNVQYAALSATDGSIGAWATATRGIGESVGAPVLAAQLRTWGKLVAVGGYLYYLGGQNSTATNEQSAVYYVLPAGSGNITADWGAATKGIGDTGSGAQARTKFGVAVWDSRIYVIGGLNGSAAVTNTVYISPQLSSGGDITANWTSDGDVPSVSRFGAAVTAYANNLYLFGGNDGTNYLNDSQFTQINSDGTIDAWTFTTSLPGPISQGEAFAANGYMYVVGGRSAATSCLPSTLIAPVSANTTIATGNNPTGVGEWYETNVRYAGGRYGAATAYNQGKVYIMGGGCTSPQNGTYNTGTIAQTTTTITGTGTNWTDNYVGGIVTYQDASTATIIRVTDTTHLVVSVSKTVGAGQTYSIAVPRHVYGVFKSQPQVAQYSRMIDTDTDVFPNSWLMNGLDNSIGARWQARYSTMHDISTSSDTVLGVLQQNPNEDCGTSATMPAMTTWGQETNFGSVTMGKVETYTPKNSSGGNINCARYYYFFISIDASQTFGYPEDVNRGPTIYDISLFFTSDPSKRLRHGKTFTGGELQPLDTPCRQSNPDPNAANCPLP